MARRINLIPRSERPRTRTDWGLLAMVGLFIVVIFALGFGYYTFSNVLDERKQELADLKMQTAALQQQVQALQQYEQLATQRESVQTVVQSIYSSRTLLSDVLDAVSLVVPENAWFQSLELTASDPAPAGDAQVATANSGNSVGKISIDGQDVQLRGRVAARRPAATHTVAHRRPVDLGQRDSEGRWLATRHQRVLHRRSKSSTRSRPAHCR